jgi:hypothetical protein
MFAKRSRRCGVLQIKMTILWSLPIRPRFLHRFSSFKRSDCSLNNSISFSKAPNSLPYRKALHARLMTCPRHRSRRAVRFFAVHPGKKCLRTASIAVSLFVALSVIKYPIRDRRLYSIMISIMISA